MTNYAHQQSKGNKHNCVLLFNTTLSRPLKSQERGGGGGVVWIPIEGDDRMGAEINPPPKKKSLGLSTKPQMDQKLTPQQSNVEFPRLKNFQKALTNNMKNTPKNLDLNQATQKYTCQIFLPKRKNLESKILNPPKSLIILIT